MSAEIAIIYATVDGQTRKISGFLKQELERNGVPADLFSIEEFSGPISRYGKLIIGSSIRYGVHNKKIIDFVKKHGKELSLMKTAFFSVNLVARKPEKCTADTNPYVKKFFKTVDWKPALVAVFAGKLNYKIYSFTDKMMIRLIMWITGGPTNSDADIEYTDWEKVKEFGLKIIDI